MGCIPLCYTQESHKEELASKAAVIDGLINEATVKAMIKTRGEELKKKYARSLQHLKVTFFAYTKQCSTKGL